MLHGIPSAIGRTAIMRDERQNHGDGYALETVHSAEQFERALDEWTSLAQEVEGAKVDVISWGDPLGGRSYMLWTNSLALYELGKSRIRREERTDLGFS